VIHERIDLCLIGPAHDELATVVDPLAIVLFVPFPVLDLTGPGDRLLLRAEVGYGVHAHMVGATP
jgi:hypothetical protein